jgi:hypothetical protein
LDIRAGFFGSGVVILLTRRPLKDFYLPFGAAASPATLMLIRAQHLGRLSFFKIYADGK